MNDMLAGVVDSNVEALTKSAPNHKAGQYQALAVLSEARQQQLPDVPTFKELGFPSVVGESWFAVFAPAGTPQQVVEKLNASISRIVRSPDFDRRMKEIGNEPVTSDFTIVPMLVLAMLVLAMHARFNPFLIWHDMHWAVPLGHWAMAIADLDAGRQTHVAIWMAELYEEQRRRGFTHVNHFTGPAAMITQWLLWTCHDVHGFSDALHEICDSIIRGFPHLSGHLIEIEAAPDGTRTLKSHPLKPQEDFALQATLFA